MKVVIPDRQIAVKIEAQILIYHSSERYKRTGSQSQCNLSVCQQLLCHGNYSLGYVFRCNTDNVRRYVIYFRQLFAH